MHSSVSDQLILKRQLFPKMSCSSLNDPALLHSLAGLMYIAYRLVVLVHKNIQVTTITNGYIQLRQGFEC